MLKKRNLVLTPKEGILISIALALSRQGACFAPNPAVTNSWGVYYILHRGTCAVFSRLIKNHLLPCMAREMARAFPAGCETRNQSQQSWRGTPLSPRCVFILMPRVDFPLGQNLLVVTVPKQGLFQDYYATRRNSLPMCFISFYRKISQNKWPLI